MPSTSDAQRRLQFLYEVGTQLWPSPAALHVQRAWSQPKGRVVSEFLLVAGCAYPRLLIPLASRRAAATAVRGYGEQADRRARVVNRLTWLAVRSRTALWLLPDRVRIVGPERGPRDDIESHLAQVLNTEIRVSMHLSAQRANRKPVLQVMDHSGQTIAFVKVGVDHLTRRLVDHEAWALSNLAEVPRRWLHVPHVLSHHRWNGLSVLALSPLAVNDARVPESGQRERALLELMGHARADSPLQDSAWWQEVRQRLEQLEPGAAARGLARSAARLEQVARQTTLTFAAAHGDWTSWNTAVTRAGVLAWDWERFALAVPVGYDLVHLALQDRVVGNREPLATAVRAVLSEAPGLLARFVPDPDRAALVAALYLIDIGCRYLSDGQAEAGAPAGRLEQWLLPALEDQVGRVSGLGEGEIA